MPNLRCRICVHLSAHAGSGKGAAAGGGGQVQGGGGGSGVNDDTGSVGSAVSGMDDVAGASGHQADYRRGKRFKKLAAILGSATVQRAALNFRWQALLANVMQLLSNLVSFVVLTLLLRAQISAVEDLRAAGRGIVHVHELMICMNKVRSVVHDHA